MTDWLIASNPSTFDVDSAFSDRDVIDWSEVSNAHLGTADRVFLYQIAPVQAITHVCEVIRTGITSPDMLDDREYWRDASALEDRHGLTWMRLSLLHAVTRHEQELLTLPRLREAGLKAAPQGRMRAPGAVTALVSGVMDHQASDPSELIRREQDLIADLDFDRQPWRFRRGMRGGTRTLASFTYALSMPDAPTALAMLRTYLTAVGLDQTDRWSVSAMPSWAGATDHQRFATVSGAGIELFYIWFEISTGTVTEWGTRLPAEQTFLLPPLDTLWQSTADNGDNGVHGETLADLLDALGHRPFLETLRATSELRQGSRRADWHNPYLGALLGATGAPVSRETEPAAEEDIEFERRYIERVTRFRLHQGPLREAALRKYGARCMYCGLDNPEVLEAAHVIPDSRGGAASTSNIRVLCANHHTAFDAGLIVLDGDRLVPAEGAREVPPRRPIPIAIPVGAREVSGDPDDVNEGDDDERHQWVVTDPYELTPYRLGDTVLYDQADESDLYAEGTLLGIHFVSEDLSHPMDITYRLEIRPTGEDESVTVTVSGDGYVSRYIDTEDHEDW
ncbi:HNH endonuclease [Brachybacterium tyrofermentans]|uniref:HNH endonuclease n=1 Tax=Brachybacterium tyrofermentans TaxID=47848 RepID=UPI003FD5CA0C